MLVRFLVCAVLLTACGARWNEDQKTAVRARDSRNLSEASNSSDAKAARDGAVESSEVAPDQSALSDAPSGDGSATSSVAARESPGRGFDGGERGEVGARPCAAPSNATGVTDSTIRVGSITTLSGPVPGFGETSLGAVRAYAAYLNASGGICGRTVEVVAADDGYDNGRYRSILQEQASTVLGVVGGLASGDAGGSEVAAQTGIPIVTVPVAVDYHSVPSVFGMNPPYAEPNRPIGKYDWLASQGVTKAAVVYTAVDQTRAEFNRKHRPQMEAAGIQIVDVQELPLATLNYDAAASRVNESGAQYMLFIGETGMNASMARSLARYDLEYPDYLTGYSPDFIGLAGEGAEGSMAWIRTLPTEEAGSNPEQARFIEWMRRAAPGLALDQFAADGWVAAKAFFDVLQNLPGPISRDALVRSLSAVDKFDAGGFMGPINLGAKTTNGCFIAMQVLNGRWQRITPRTGFLC